MKRLPRLVLLFVIGLALAATSACKKCEQGSDDCPYTAPENNLVGPS